MSSNDHKAAGAAGTAAEAAAIAAAFVEARLRGGSLPAFPGAIPADLVAAYAVQDLAIARWPDRVVGWKVGYIGADRRDGSGDDRLLGPIFARQLQQWVRCPLAFRDEHHRNIERQKELERAAPTVIVQ